MTTDSVPYTLSDYVGVLRRRWIYLATILPTAVLSAIYLAFALPTLYRSTGTLMLEPSSIPEDMVRTTVTTYADQQIEIVQRRIMTADNLAGLIEQVDPYPGSNLSSREKAQLVASNTSVERVDPITLEPLDESNAFSIHYLNPDPAIARTVAQQIISMFLVYNQERRTVAASETHRFLQEQSQRASDRISELEYQLADFKTTYGNALPEAQVRNLNALDRTERELDGLEQQILIAEERRTLLDLQLGQITPYLFDTAGSWRVELAELHAQLAVARQRYTEDHPTVKRLLRSIEDMSSRVDLQSPDQPVAPDNFDYIRVARQLDTVVQELAALRSRATTARRQMDVYDRSLQIAPEVEREYRQLIRDYDVAKFRFGEIETSLSAAVLAQVLEFEQRGNRLILIRSPNRPSRPDSPNRIAIILLGFVLGGAMAAGLAATTESVDPTIRSIRDLNEITDVQPLGSVPNILNGADRRNRFLAWTSASVVASAAIAYVGFSLT